jgi:4-alpha-glucanotransferase
MRFPRASGVLLHPTSLPGPGGIGSLGPEAERFLEDLRRAGQKIWQVLPLGPTGAGNSPYQSFTAFGGNPLLICPRRLVEDGLLEESDLGGVFPDDRVDFAAVVPFRTDLLRRAWTAFCTGRGPGDVAGRVRAFREREARWLEDWALFVAIKEAQGGVGWMDWPAELTRRDEAALARCRSDLSEAIDRAVFEQFLFFEHWGRVHAKAKELGIEVFGDLPIFVAGDSADVWAHQDLFDLDGRGRPRVVAGVPPDYFSATGQLWGNPLYRWDVHRERGFAWWIDRVRASFAMFDRLRIDHFRGFEDYWEIPAGEPTAVNGRWVAGPRDDFFQALRDGLGELPIVAEDLGDVTQAVFDLRDRWGFPGMRVLQFGFADDSGNDSHTPSAYPTHCVAYTGTHDNDTVRGWFDGSEHTTMDAAAKEAQRARVLRATGGDGSAIHWDLIRLVLSSAADTAIVPMQDVLGLGTEARMNVPGHPDGNWEWRLRPGQFGEEAIGRLAELTAASGR